MDAVRNIQGPVIVYGAGISGRGDGSPWYAGVFI